MIDLSMIRMHQHRGFVDCANPADSLLSLLVRLYYAECQIEQLQLLGDHSSKA